MSGVTTDGRRYRGRDAGQRQAERRARLLAAGLELFGTEGYAASSVKVICAEAGLTQRYFYESFTEREQLLGSVYDEQIGVLRAAVEAAVATAGEHIESRIRAGLTALIDTMTEDPRRAKVVVIEVVGVSPVLEARRREVLHAFVRYIAALVPAEAETTAPHRLETGVMVLVGGVSEVLVDLTLGYRTATTPELVEIITALFMGGYRALGTRPR